MAITTPEALPSGPASAPRILCLHGGGTNASIFRFQLRSILSRSSPNFRFVFAEAPFLSPPHAAVAEIFADAKPFRRWLRYLPDHEEIGDDVAAESIVKACREAIEGDKEGSGEWVGVLGFSQGAKMVASLLWAQQTSALLGVNFKFGVLLNGRYPVVRLASDLPDSPHTSPAGWLSSELPPLPSDNDGEHTVRIPTVHVHGLQDPDIKQHRLMRDLWFSTGSTRLVEWNGDHRLPVKPADVDAVLEQMYDLAEQAGLIITRSSNGV